MKPLQPATYSNLRSTELSWCESQCRADAEHERGRQFDLAVPLFDLTKPLRLTHFQSNSNASEPYLTRWSTKASRCRARFLRGGCGESAFTTFREAAYDRLAQQFSTGPWLDQTLLHPALVVGLTYARISARQIPRARLLQRECRCPRFTDWPITTCRHATRRSSRHTTLWLCFGNPLQQVIAVRRARIRRNTSEIGRAHV